MKKRTRNGSLFFCEAYTRFLKTENLSRYSYADINCRKETQAVLDELATTLSTL